MGSNRIFITTDFKLSLPKCFWGSFANRTQNSSENSKFENLSNGEGFRDIQHSMSTLLDPGFHIRFIIKRFNIKCDRYYHKMRQLFYYKMRQKFIWKCVRFLITKCDNFITKCDSYYKLRQFYYKMRQLLQNATFITNCDSTVLIKIQVANSRIKLENMS